MSTNEESCTVHPQPLSVQELEKSLITGGEESKGVCNSRDAKAGVANGIQHYPPRPRNNSGQMKPIPGKINKNDNLVVACNQDLTPTFLISCSAPEFPVILADFELFYGDEDRPKISCCYGASLFTGLCLVLVVLTGLVVYAGFWYNLQMSGKN